MRCLTYGRVFREWIAAPPPAAERQVMHELVNELLESVRALPVITRSGLAPAGTQVTAPPPSQALRATGAGDRKTWRPPKKKKA
jgi:hypothetical protein